MSMILTQHDWQRFLDPNGLAEKCGVPQASFGRMLLKELVDNAADAGGASIDEIDADTVRISDTGSGMDLAAFDLKRPLVSGKHWRTAQRGALGNGLRAVMGALYCLDGSLIVETRGAITLMTVDDQGETVREHLGASERAGTVITVKVADIDDAVPFAMTPIKLSGPVLSKRRPSPYWFDEGAIIDLQRSAEGVTTSDFVAQFGTRYKAGAGLVTDMDPDTLLAGLQAGATAAPKVSPCGRDAFFGSYAKEVFTARVGDADLPVVVEVWATATSQKEDHGSSAMLVVNRTRSLSAIHVDVGPKGRVELIAGGYRYRPLRADRDRTLRRNVDFDFTVSLSTPFVPLLSSGKAPDLGPFASHMISAIQKAGRKAQAAISIKKSGVTIQDAVSLLMPEAYDRVSDGGKYWANARQLMYAMRPQILEMCGIDKFADKTVTQTAIPAFLSANLAAAAHMRIAYDKRGALIEPHTGRSVGLGTVEVAQYTQDRPGVRLDRDVPPVGLLGGIQPAHRYGGLLFIEKEGYHELITESGIKERNDIALASTKGMSVTAARALIDYLAGEVPDFRVYVLADFDITGQSIVHTLTRDSDRYAFRNHINVEHIGVGWDLAQSLHAAGMSEPVAIESGRRGKAADLLRERGVGEEAVAFLTGAEPRRVEINALTSRQLLDLLEAHIDCPKVMPPADVLAEGWAEQEIRARLAGYERSLRSGPAPTAPDDLEAHVRERLEADSSLSWDAALAEMVGR